MTLTPAQIASVAAAPHAFASQDISATINAALTMATGRKKLPNRRPNATVMAEWQGHGFTVTVGFDAAGSVREVFANHAKGDMAATLADECVVISIALQWGVPVADLAKSLGTVPAWPDGTAPASPIGTIIAEIAKITQILEAAE